MTWHVRTPRTMLGALLAAVVAGIALSVACGDDDDGATGEGSKVQALTTLPLFADFIREVGGERVEVTSLLPAGADPHTWEPAPKDVVKVEEADIVFVNGLDLEPAALNIIEANIGDISLVEMAEEADVEVHGDEDDEEDQPGDGKDPGEEPEDDGHGHSEGDPHLWMDPANAIAYAAVIRDHLSEADPDGSSAYGSNYDSYAAEIEDANTALEGKAATVAEENRKLITTHDAFGYLAEHIGFGITAFVSEGPGQDASPGDIAAIVEAVEGQGVPAVFREPQISGESDTLEQVAEDTGAMICELYSDSLDDEVSTYIEMMRHNGDELARCLGGANGG